MRVFYLVASSVLSVVLCSVAMADPVHGRWEMMTSEPQDRAQIVIGACSGKVCGTFSMIPDPEGKDLVGKIFISGMQADGAGRYSGGQIWAADEDKTYRGKLELNGDRLKVSGCVLGGLVCRGETFRRLQ